MIASIHRRHDVFGIPFVFRALCLCLLSLASGPVRAQAPEASNPVCATVSLLRPAAEPPLPWERVVLDLRLSRKMALVDQRPSDCPWIELFPGDQVWELRAGVGVSLLSQSTIRSSEVLRDPVNALVKALAILDRAPGLSLPAMTGPGRKLSDLVGSPGSEPAPLVPETSNPPAASPFFLDEDQLDSVTGPRAAVTASGPTMAPEHPTTGLPSASEPGAQEPATGGTASLAIARVPGTSSVLPPTPGSSTEEPEPEPAGPQASMLPGEPVAALVTATEELVEQDQRSAVPPPAAARGNTSPQALAGSLETPAPGEPAGVPAAARHSNSTGPVSAAGSAQTGESPTTVMPASTVESSRAAESFPAAESAEAPESARSAASPGATEPTQLQAPSRSDRAGEGAGQEPEMQGTWQLPSSLRLALALQTRLQGTGGPTLDGRLDLAIALPRDWRVGAWLLAPQVSPVVETFAGEPEWYWSLGLGIRAPIWCRPGLILGLSRRGYLPANLEPDQRVSGFVPLAGLEGTIYLLPRRIRYLHPALRMGVDLDLRPQEFLVLEADSQGNLLEADAQRLVPLAFHLDLLLEWSPGTWKSSIPGPGGS